MEDKDIEKFRISSNRLFACVSLSWSTLALSSAAEDDHDENNNDKNDNINDANNKNSSKT